MNKYLLYIFLIFPALFTGCKSMEKIKLPVRTEMSYRERIAENIKPAAYPEYLLIDNADMKIEAENSSNARLIFFMEKEKMIFASIRVMGFEVIRAQLTQDSVKYINRFKKEYYFGSVEENRKYIPLTYDLNLLQNFIYSGFYFEEDRTRKKDYLNHFNVRDDFIQYEKIIDEGQKIQMNYDRDFVKLDNMKVSDYPNMIMADIDIQRENRRVENIDIVFILRKFETLIDIDIKDIKHKNFDKTDFKIGRNYTELEKLF